MDLVQLSKVLGGVIDPQQSIREAAELAFNSIKAENPDQLALLLLGILKTESESVEKRQQAAIAFRTLLRDFLMGTTPNAWEQMKPETREVIKTELLNLSVDEKSSRVQQAIGNVISDLGSALSKDNEWPELPKALSTMMSHPNEQVQILGLTMCAALQASLSDSLSGHLLELAGMLQAKLDSTNPDLRLAALTLVTQFVCNEGRSQWKIFEPFLPGLMLLLVQFAKEEIATESVHCSDMLKKLIEVAEVTPEWFKPHAQQVLETFLALTRNTELSDQSRQLAAELILTIIENRPTMVTKIPDFIANLIEVLIDFMLDIEDDAIWLTRQLSSESDDETRNFDVGECGLDRVGNALDSELVMPLIFAQIGRFLQHQDWKHKVAGLVAISQTVEYIPEYKVEAQLGDVVKLLLQQLKDEHYRVRFAACRALGQVALDHQPHVQLTYHSDVLPALIQAFDDPIARVQSQAFAAFVNFAEAVEIEDLLIYVPEVMAKVMTRLDLNFRTPNDMQSSPETVANQHRCIREQCITSVAVISGVLADQFIPYCGTIVPLMKSIVMQCTNDEDRQLRGRALECLSIIAYSVGVKHLEQDIAQIFQALISLFHTEMSNDDPVKEYVHEALRRLIKCLGVDGGPYIAEIIPKVLEGFSVVDQQLAPSDIDRTDYTLIVNADGGLSGVKTSTLEDIQRNLQLLSACSEAMAGAFAPWITQSMSAVTPLIEMKYSDSVRRLALYCVADLLAGARAAHLPLTTVTTWLLATIDTVFNTIDCDEEASLGGLAQGIKSAGSDVLDGNHVKTVCEKVFELIDESSSRRIAIEKAKEDPDADEENVKQCEDEAEREQAFREALLRILESLLRTHADLFLEYGGEMCLAFVKTMIQRSRSSEDRSLALYICCDVLEQLGARGLALLGNELMQQVIVDITDSNEHVRQAACYAMSIAVTLDELDQVLVEETARRLLIVISDPAAHERDNKDATENAVAAMMALVMYKSTLFGPQLQSHATLVISHLPLCSDEEEAQKVHQKLLTCLQDPHSVFWGTENSNLPLLVKIFGSVYKSSYSTDETDVAIRGLVSQIGLTNLPNIIGQRAISAIERRGLQKIERDLATPAAA